MKIKTEAFQSCLEAVIPLTTGRNFVPILSCVHLSADDGRLEMRATNSEAYATARAECDGRLDPVCVSADKIKRLASAANGEIEFQAKNQRLIFRSVGTADVSVFPPKEFPDFPEEKLTPIGVNTEDLAKGIEGVLWAAGNDPDQGVLRSVHVVLSENQMLCEASNRKALSQYKQGAIAAKAEFLCPLKYARMVVGALNQEGAELSINDKMIRVSSGGGEVIVSQINGKFPPTKLIVNVERQKVGEFKVQELIGHLRVMQSLASEKDQWSVIFECAKTGCTLRFNGQNKYEVSIGGQFADGIFKTRFDVLISALAQHRAEKVVIHKDVDGSQIMFMDSNLTHIISLLRA